MKTISYYISMAVILTAAIFTGGCTDDDEKSLSLRSGDIGSSASGDFQQSGIRKAAFFR